jgi:hypothetical protein
MDDVCGKMVFLDKPVGAANFLNKPRDFLHIFFKADGPAVPVHRVGPGAAVDARRF